MSTSSNNLKQQLSGNIISLTNKHPQIPQQVHHQQQQQQQQHQSSQHHQQSQQQHQQQLQQSQPTLQSLNPVNHQHQSQQQHLQQVHQQQHPVPPRYQPPPQPPGGILKHIGLKDPRSTIPSYYHQSTDLNAPHLNIKYPPEVPKLASVYVPDSVKASGIPSRIPSRSSTNRLSSGGGQPENRPTNNQHNQHQRIHQSIEDEQQQQQQQQPQQFTTSRLSQPSHHQQLQHQQQQQQHHQQQQEMLKFVRKPDSDSASTTTTATQQSSATSGSNNTQHQQPTSATNGGRLTAEQNRHLQSLIAELRSLKEANQRLSDDNQELRDLCCFLDDDRQKGRKLAREWQRFGRYTASVMRQEVSAYQNKLRQLDDKQQELIRDNLELKELCLYLDEERANAAAIRIVCQTCGATNGPALRDDGDGSSSSTNADEPMPSIRPFETNILELNIRSSLSDQTLQYVRSLERKIRLLEEERISGNNNNNNNLTNNNVTTNGQNEPISGRPEAVVRALQVLEVREQLERDRGGNIAPPPEQMDDGEKALVREMCNVVWRKLEDGPNGPNGMDHL